MLIDLREIPPEGRRFEGEEPETILQLGPDDDIRPAGAIRYNLFVQIVSDEVIVRGSLAMKADLRCVRCAKEFSGEIEDRAVEFSGALRAFVARSAGEDGLEEGAAGTETMDLTSELREATILAFPSFPVCKPDCRGLCPTCGTDLNKKRCKCAPPSDSRWESLSGLDIR